MQISDTTRAAIGEVAIDTKVSVTADPQFFSGPGSLFAAGTGGLVGGLIDAREQRKHQSYGQFLAQSGIDVGEIVRRTFEQEICNDPFFGPRLRQSAPYRFELEIPFYSLTQKNSFSDFYRPGISVKVRLIGPGGERVAEGIGSSCSFGDCLGYHTLAEIQANPQLLAAQYQLAAQIAIRKVMETLR